MYGGSVQVGLSKDLSLYYYIRLYKKTFQIIFIKKIIIKIIVFWGSNLKFEVTSGQILDLMKSIKIICHERSSEVKILKVDRLGKYVFFFEKFTSLIPSDYQPILADQKKKK